MGAEIVVSPPPGAATGVKFRPCPGVEAGLYLVGDNGSVWSCLTRLGRPEPWRRLRGHLSPGGWRAVTLCVRPRPPRVRVVGRLVLAAFAGPRSRAWTVGRHDRSPAGLLDDSLANLFWRPISEAIIAGWRGVRHPKTKITPDLAAEIRRLRAAGLSRQAIADLVGVSPTLCGYVYRNVRWAERPAVSKHGPTPPAV
jgi:hypothetical protein